LKLNWASFFSIELNEASSLPDQHFQLRRRGAPRQPPDRLVHDLVGGDRNDSILRGFAAQGLKVDKENFAFRTDDVIVVWRLSSL